MLTARVALRQRSLGEARNAIYNVLSSVLVKVLYVVDPDIDIFSDAQMEWAMATRFQPDRDYVVASAFRTIPLDPSLASHGSLGAKAGFDLTMPIGTQKKLEAQIPEPPHFEGPRFASVEDALRDGPKFFEQLRSEEHTSE